MFWMWCGIIGFGLLGLIIVLLVAGIAYQGIRSKREKRKYPPPGEMVDVGGYKLHLYSAGSGGPAVILDAGLGCISTHWCLVQPEIAKFTQAVSFDRAGLGWSESSPFPRTSKQIVQELHTLLINAHIPKPYVLVGHSFGGINVQLYAATYPDEVLGLVLVDSGDEQMEKKMPPVPGEAVAKFFMKPLISYLMAASGFYRFFAERKIPKIVSSPFDGANLAVCTTAKHVCAIAAQFRCLTESLEQLENMDRSLIENKPCFVLTAGLENAVSASAEKQKIMHETKVIWDGLQKDLASRFVGSHHLIAEKSDHMIPFRQPELIVYAVQELIKTCSGTQEP
jgi:pimeloyl-ACP methyl ester carboxylesterase